ncbi:MAG: hypothetical protein CEN88_464 [Candidatus Berkelbacteria bacterium Licking1014_2]|uniref:Uncharacterized protein n=1 Tax=Candidatus Berkelbacteria bacterium Licking1014_2 TaxID=2017146 RepID=A0A554LRM0_9BACT|nr:MAG: hypothetical protein CEN88_464 [Candidatus Berkelbacteria bacterium Licking1014_2]
MDNILQNSIKNKNRFLQLILIAIITLFFLIIGWFWFIILPRYQGRSSEFAFNQIIDLAIISGFVAGPVIYLIGLFNILYKKSGHRKINLFLSLWTICGIIIIPGVYYLIDILLGGTGAMEIGFMFIISLFLSLLILPGLTTLISAIMLKNLNRASKNTDNNFPIAKNNTTDKNTSYKLPLYTAIGAVIISVLTNNFLFKTTTSSTTPLGFGQLFENWPLFLIEFIVLVTVIISVSIFKKLPTNYIFNFALKTFIAYILLGFVITMLGTLLIGIIAINKL